MVFLPIQRSGGITIFHCPKSGLSIQHPFDKNNVMNATPAVHVDGNVIIFQQACEDRVVWGLGGVTSLPILMVKIKFYPNLYELFFKTSPSDQFLKRSTFSNIGSIGISSPLSFAISMIFIPKTVFFMCGSGVRHWCG